MRIKTVALLAVAVGCGLFAMLGVRKAMEGKQSGPQEEKVSVLVAVTEIPIGTELTPENVMFKEVAVTLVPEEPVMSEEQYKDRAAKFPLMPNDFVTMSKLTEPGERGRSVQISKGMRVVSVKVNDTQTHSNMLAPGDRVDLVVTYQSRNQRGMTTKTQTLLEYVEIFATGNKTATDGDKDRDAQVKNVSLLVTPEQANYVYLAERKGELSLVWRNIADDEQVQVATVDEDLLKELSGTIDKDARYGFQSPYNSRGEGNEPPAGVASWLEEQEPEPEPTPAPVTQPVSVAQAEPEDPLRPTWKMVIYSGDNAETVELELPVEETPKADDDTTLLEGEDKGLVAENDVPEGTEPVNVPIEEISPIGSILKQFQNLPFNK